MTYQKCSRSIRATFTLCVSSLALGLTACQADNPKQSSQPALQPADHYISGGVIYSGLNDSADLGDIAVLNGAIICTSRASDCAGHIGNETNRINLDGAALYPGFTDSHGHLLGIGQREMTLNLEGTASIAQLKTTVSEYAKDVPSGQVIFGRGWIETHWPENRFPTRYDLDEISTDHPILLQRADGHAIVANSKALDIAGITAKTSAPFGGDILRGKNDEPTGMLIDNAQDMVSDLFSAQDTPELRRQAYTRGASVYAAYGWTGLHNMSVPSSDVAIMETLTASGELPIRVYNALDMSPQALDILSEIDSEGPLQTRAIKLYSDGALGSRGAALLAEYDDDAGNSGLITLKKNDAIDIFKMALRSGIQINTHAIGDKGNRFVLDWYEEALAAVPEAERAIANPRWRIEHAQILSLEDLPRFAQLGIIPSMQPSHAIGDLHFAVDRIGVERLRGGYSWRSLIDSGAIIAGGTDAPVERGDPRIEFYAAISRKDMTGFSTEGWYPEQRVSRYEALKMFTQWAAYASFREDELGTIEVGKQADFTVFEDDIMTIPEADILTTPVKMTIVGGQIIYQREP